MAKSTPLQYPVQLTSEQRCELELLCKNGHAPAKKIRRAKVVLLSDRHQSGGRLTRTQIAEQLGIHPNTVDDIRKQFVLEGTGPTLARKVRQTPPTQPILDGASEACLIAICCTEQPPAGRSEWTMELLAAELKSRKIVTKISAETVRRALKKRTQAVAEKIVVRARTGHSPVRGSNGRRAGRLSR